jgi:hypothetical protein
MTAQKAPGIAGHRGDRILRLFAVLGFSLALGACSRCDVPIWQPNQPVPHACHGTPSPE